MDHKDVASKMQRMERPDRITKRRQDPVSCKLCRAKKLKCNRQYPCGNCTQRGLACEFESSRASPSSKVPQDGEPTNAAIFAKLQRVEDLLLRIGSNDPNTPESLQGGSEEAAATHVLSPAVHDISLRHLESSAFNMGGRSGSILPVLADSFEFEVSSLSEIAAQETLKPNMRKSGARGADKLILLPSRMEALVLLERYVKFICFYHNIVHIPTLDRICQSTYDQLAQGAIVKNSHVTLLLSCFASTLWYSSWSSDSDRIVSDTLPRSGVFLYWMRCALDLLTHTERVLPSTLEDTQASIILVFLDYSLEGFSYRPRSVMLRALQWARDQGMHKIDAAAPLGGDSTEEKTAMIEREFRRRVWWHLSASDWMTSLAGGFNEGTYTVHPAQMRVRLPRNVDDEVLEAGTSTEDLPVHQPTKMAYSLVRIKVAEIARSVIDALRLGLGTPTAIEYSQIMALESRLNNVVAELPIFFQLDDESMRQSRQIIIANPHIGMHRYLINVAIESTRCRLHAPFLTRAGNDPNSRQSSEICLQSAMNVLKLNQIVRRDPDIHLAQQLKSLGMLHHMFLATVVLVMDFCFNKGVGEHDPRRGEVLGAIQFLQEARNHSAAADKFLDSLMEILKQHEVNILGPQTQPDVFGLNIQRSAEPQLGLPEFTRQGGILSQAGTLAYLPTQANFMGDGQWLDPNAQANPVDWEQLFSELDGFIP